MLWIGNLVGGVFLLLLLAVRQNVRHYLAFTIYIFLNLTLGILALGVYQRWGFLSTPAWQISWSMQALVIITRASAVTEVCRHLLSRYRGVWALAWRVLLACAAVVLLYSTVASRGELGFLLPLMARGMELAIAAAIAAVFLFVRYYDAEVQQADRMVAVGFFLYSSFNVLNNTVLERFSYVPLWNFLSMLAFLASVLVWGWALRYPQPAAVPPIELLPSSVYDECVPQINLRLRKVNEALCKFWKIEVPPS